MKCVAHVPDIDGSVNSSYFVLMSGVKAQAYINFMATLEFTPSQPVASVTTFCVDHRDYRVAKRGHAIQADLSLECIMNSRGSCYCPVRKRRYNKVVYLMPLIFNPMVINFYNPDGSAEMRPAHDHPRPDRTIKIPLNVIIIDDFTSLTLPYIPAPAMDLPGPSNPRPPAGPSGGNPPGNILQPPRAFEIYVDNNTPDSSQTSTTSNNSNLFPDLTATFKSGMILDKVAKASRSNDSETFSPAASSTETPPGNASARQKATPSKTPLSKKALRKTPSQPAITDFTTSMTQSSLPSPIPTSSTQKRKRILQPIEEDQRPAKRNIFPSHSQSDPVTSMNESIMMDDTSITKAKSNLDQSAINFLSANIPDNQQILDLNQLQSTSPLNTTPPSKSEFDITTPTQSSISSDIKPFDPDTDTSQTTSRQGTSNPPGKFDNNDYVMSSSSSTGSDRTPQDQPITFNVEGALIARAEMLRAPRPRRAPPCPEHILIVLEEDEMISELLYFYSSHDPLDILEAYWNSSIDIVVSDEGIEISAEVTPPASSITPSSSMETQQGSTESKPDMVTNTSTQTVSTETDSSVEITHIVIPGEATIDIVDDSISKEQEEGEGDQEEGRGHANN